MRQTKAKAIRRYVKERFPFLSPTPTYRRGQHGETQVVLANTCQRFMYKLTKQAYKTAQQESK